ncbi:MAG: type II toxin-antitoxin system VapC family toxin [Acidobacteria bacterium]|nr:type II toxin-antitoxin system VapC family toxin [Acidobacteriota bacterium]MBI3425521.1 type II toxin-antitoxin system VapC family toxin [Acidobacteriota bacterium]
MKYLLDTHTFIWWDSEPAKLSATVATILQNRQHTILLSVASAWEIQIKFQLGKLDLQLSLATIVANQIQQNQFKLLPVGLEHVLALNQLPAVHKDPFDRLLAAQSMVEQATLLSADAIFAGYPVNTLW